MKVANPLISLKPFCIRQDAAIDGNVNEKVLPFPGILSICIFPPLRTRNSLHNINPNPVPDSPAVPFVV